MDFRQLREIIIRINKIIIWTSHSPKRAPDQVIRYSTFVSALSGSLPIGRASYYPSRGDFGYYIIIDQQKYFVYF